jgi:phosphoenolpyruvate synthase/pyruvate phosphate dikinase
VSTRQNGYLRVFRHDSIRTYLADEAREKIGALIKFRKKEIEQTKKITGTVASRPDKSILTIKGTAFVLTTAFGADESVKAMRPGSILFATQTHPNLVPYMKKALAIVTDEGGVTCHAAIVSREIGKPCIIGTRLATKVVKTGDKVALNLKTGEIDF